MKTFMLVAGLATALSGCTTTAKQTAWGKPGVSKQDYGTDVGMCNGLAVMQNGGDGSRTAGGIDGSNNSLTLNSPGASGSTAPPAGSGGADSPPVAPIPASGSFSGMASADFAQRAATQQRTAEMAAHRARAEALKSCLVGRGYQEFVLNEAQRNHLASLEKGSNEYLYKLGSDAEVVGRQSRAPAK